MTLSTLFYVEPVPIRDHAIEHEWVGSWFLRLIAQGQWDQRQVAILANPQVEERLQQQASALGVSGVIFLSLSEALKKTFESFARLPWNPFGAAEWARLLRNEGQLAAEIIAELGTIRNERFPFTSICTWGPNGAVSAFCEREGLPLLSCEAGALRPPLPNAFYADPCGTHGQAMLPHLRTDQLPISRVPCSELIEVLAIPAQSSRSSRGRRALVALQLADDANMIGPGGYPGGPEAFLSTALPSLLANGYDDITVKGHPGAKFRPINLECQERALRAAIRLPGVSVMDQAPQGAGYMKWLASFDLVSSVSSSISFEASLAGARVTLERPASFAAYDAYPTLDAALMGYIDWESYVRRAEQNALFYCTQYVLYNYEQPDSSLRDTISFSSDMIGAPINEAYATAWAEQLGTKRLERFRAVILSA